MRSHPTVPTLALAFCLSCGPSWAEEGGGLRGTYYGATDLSRPVHTRIDPTIDFTWSAGPGVAGIGTERYSVLWKGQVKPPATGTYAFHVTSDDGVRLVVDGRMLVNNWTDHGAIENTGTIALTAGKKYDIMLQYYQNRGRAVAQLRWSSDSIPKGIIPATSLFPASTAPRPLEILSELTSHVSPAWVEGSIDQAADAVSAQVAGTTAPVTREAAEKWFISTTAAGAPLGIPLSPGIPTEVRVSATTRGATTSITRTVTWEPVDLIALPYGMETIVVRAGDTLLVTLGGATRTAEIDTAYDGQTFKPVLTGTPTARFKVPCTIPGTTILRGRRDGVLAGQLTVTGVGVDLAGPIAAELGFCRNKDVRVLPATTVRERLAFVANDPDWLLVDRGIATATGSKLGIMPLSFGNRVLQARIGDEYGPVIAQQPVAVFTLTTNASATVDIIDIHPDGSQLAQARLTMTPRIPDLTVTLKTFVSGVTFDDSTTRKVISSNDFTADGTAGFFPYQLLRAPAGHANLCHAFSVSQQGVTISH